MAARDDDDFEERVSRTVEREGKEAAFFDKKDAAAERDERSRINADREREALARLAVAKAQRAAAARPRFKQSYEGPDPQRQVIDNKAVVSKEELADFQRKNPGATLRDLLNADKGLTRSGAPTATAMRSMGLNRAATSDSGANMRARGQRAPAPTSATDIRARGRRSSQEPNALPRTDENYDAFLDLQLGNFSSSPAEMARSGKIIRKEPTNYRKGGSTKAYAKGGSVRGAGIAQRGVKKCKVY